MNALFFWPDKPALSLLALWILSSVFLWASREPMLQMLRNLGKSLEGGLRSISQWCMGVASGLRERSRESLIAANELELGTKMSRELLRIDGAFSQKLGEYATLHRKLDDTLQKLDCLTMHLRGFTVSDA